MIPEDKQNHVNFFQKAIDYLEQQGYSDIKADLDGYEKPESYVNNERQTTLTPDIVAEKDGYKYYFELGTKSQKPQLLKTKWLLLDRLSDLKNFYFKIITTRGHYRFTDQVINDLGLESTKLIKI
ncbi:MAG: hypothetical protein R2798_08810 [Chitinophagales bacterium]|nr:hypothetical protein [Bacteroidota bacterium]MCB9043946.1 hypothetical protein [Chitinophagales bacterium]